MDMNKTDQTWVPSMPPLLSPNLKVFGLETLALCLDQKKRKTGTLKGKRWGRGFTQQLKNIQMLQWPSE